MKKIKEEKQKKCTWKPVCENDLLAQWMTVSLGPKLTHFKTYCCARWFSTSCSYLAIKVVESKI